MLLSSFEGILTQDETPGMNLKQTWVYRSNRSIVIHSSVTAIERDYESVVMIGPISWFIFRETSVSTLVACL